MGLKPDAPEYPDPTKTAAAQYDYSKRAGQDQINMNALNRSGPFGSTTFTRDANGNVTGQNVSLSSTLQSGADATSGNFASQAGLLPSGPFQSTVDANGIRNAYMSNAINQATPEWERQDKQREIRMSERGLPIGSEAWTDSENQVGESRNQYLANAANNAWIAGTQEEQRQRNNQLQEYQLPYQTASQSLGLLNSLNGLQGYAPTPTASVSAPNYGQMVQNQYDAQMQQYQNEMSGLGSLANVGLGLLTAPMTGGLSLSNTLLGAGIGGMGSLFNPYTGSTTYA